MYVRDEEWEIVYRVASDIPDVSYDLHCKALELSALRRDWSGLQESQIVE